MEYFKKARDEIENYLRRNSLSFTKLPTSVLHKFSKDFVLGWALETTIFINHKPLSLYLLVDSFFPFTPPKFALSKKDLFLKWPHVEESGMLCFKLESKKKDQTISSYIHGCRLEVVQFVDKIRNGDRDEHFIDEFLSYWGQSKNSTKRFISTLDLKNKPEKVFITNIKDGKRLITASKEKAKIWLENCLGKTIKQSKIKYQNAFILWLDEYTLLPDEYPKKISDILDLVEELSPHLITTIESSIWDNKKDCILLLAVPNAEDNYGLVGISITTPTVNGSRNNKIPPDILKNQLYIKEQYISRHSVERAEPEWVHGRYTNPHILKLRKKSICFIGCGSLGSGVAKLCASGGIGNIDIIDNDSLSWANTSRHELGGYAIGENKAKTMKKFLTASFPNINVKYHEETFENVYKNNPDLFLEYDLIISTTGNWGTECLLNELCKNVEKFPPILFGWVEHFALAGHAIIMNKAEREFVDYFISEDDFQYNILSAEDMKTEYREIACGNYFQPYGYIELIASQALLADTILDFLLKKISSGYIGCYIGCKKYFIDNNAILSPYGNEIVGKYGYGTQIIKTKIY